jgi:RNA polymerase sigma factor (sigma-70 family)
MAFTLAMRSLFDTAAEEGLSSSGSAKAAASVPATPAPRLDNERSKVPLSTSDGAVLRLLARGAKREALRLLMMEHGTAVLSFCVRVLGEKDRSLAEDVRQQVFLHVYRDLDKFEPRASLRTWIFAIANHRCLDAMRACQRRRDLFTSIEQIDCESVVDSDPHFSEESIDRKRRSKILEECLSRLPIDARMALILRFCHDMSYTEIAEITGESSGAIQVRVKRSLPRLRTALLRRLGQRA